MRSFLISVDIDVDAPRRVVAEGLRFELAEDRIRQFLMGESLYGEPSLALREAYQNALDAVRLAAARRELLRLTPVTAMPEKPEIEFTQGVGPDGRAFIDCIDRGAGMNVEELSIAFCQAGVRASDLPDRAAETASFASAEPPVELWQNSRFGIGVMSYFMIADSVTVSTARLNPDGSTGSLLTMHIADPSARFDVVELGPAQTHGTHVRLWLKPGASVSAVSTLRDLVLSCPFHLRVSDGHGLEHRWLPRELNRASSELDLSARHTVSVGIPGTLWWVHESALGAVLADGIWAGVWINGIIVNLSGRDSPQLTADRRKILKIDWLAIERLADSVSTAAVKHAWHIVGTPEWLSSTTRRLPRIADAIIASASERRDRTLEIRGVRLDVSRCGYMPGDEGPALNGVSNEIANWRLTRLSDAGLFDHHPPRLDSGEQAAEPARPSDAILLGAVSHISRFDEKVRLSRWFPRTASIYEAERHLRYSVAQIVARARELCLAVRKDADDLPESNDVVRTALSFSRREDEDGRFRPLSVFDIAQTGWMLGIGTDDVVAELALRFIEFDERARTLRTTPLSHSHLVAASSAADGIAPWLNSSEEVSLRHLVRAARVCGQTCPEVVANLRALGFTDLPALRLDGPMPTDDDLLMLSQDLNSEVPFLRSDRTSNSRHLSRAAVLLGRPEDELRARFEVFGVTFSANGTPHPRRHRSIHDVAKSLGLTRKQQKSLRARQLRSMSEDGDGLSPWLDPGRTIPAWLVASLALGKRSVDEIITDYRRLGYDVEDPRTTPRRLTPGDAREDGSA